MINVAKIFWRLRCYLYMMRFIWISVLVLHSFISLNLFLLHLIFLNIVDLFLVGGIHSKSIINFALHNLLRFHCLLCLLVCNYCLLTREYAIIYIFGSIWSCWIQFIHFSKVWLSISSFLSCGKTFLLIYISRR